MTLDMKKNHGFSLIELMITVAIIGILAAIAFPAFESQARKSNRAAAQAVLLDIANKQTFYLTSQRQYASGATFYTDLYGAGAAIAPEVSRFYTVTVAADNAATPPTFAITATPVAGTKQVKDGPLVVDSTGKKTRNGVTADW
jgi:type IV pilus assembly protein PilE